MDENTIYERAKLADPNGYRLFRRNSIIIKIVLLMLYGIPLALLIGSDASLFIFIWGILGGFCIKLFSSFLRERRLSFYESKLNLISNQLIKNLSADHDALRSNIGEKLDDIQKTLDEAQNRGNVVVYGDYANIVTGSQTVNYIRDVQQVNPNLSEALTLILGHLEATGNRQAAVYFNKLTEEAEKKERSPTILKALWLALLDAAPGLKAMAQTTEIVLKWIGATEDGSES